MTHFSSDIKGNQTASYYHFRSGHFIAGLSLCCLTTSGQVGRELDHLL